MKKLLKILLWALAAILIAVLALPLWIGPVARMTVGLVGPMLTKTHVHLGVFGLNPYVGALSLGDFQLENPEGYGGREAVTLGDVRLEVEPTSVFSDVIHVRLLRLNDIFVSYVSKAGTNNIDHILMNAGLVEKSAMELLSSSDSSKSDGKSDGKSVGKSADGSSAKAKPAAPSTERKFVIDRIEIRGVLLQLGPLTLPLTPVPITLTDVGRKSGGLTSTEVWSEIWARLMQSAGALGTQLGGFGRQGLQIGKEGYEALKNLELGGKSKEAADKSIKVLGDALKSAEGLKNIFR